VAVKVGHETSLLTKNYERLADVTTTRQLEAFNSTWKSIAQAKTELRNQNCLKVGGQENRTLSYL
jgi:hypothetical protein